VLLLLAFEKSWVVKPLQVILASDRNMIGRKHEKKERKKPNDL